MNWQTSTDDERMQWLEQQRRQGESMRDIRKLARCSTNTLSRYAKMLPADLRPQQRPRPSRTLPGHCPTCGYLVDEPGECFLCKAQRQGQVVLYHRLEAMHG